MKTQIKRISIFQTSKIVTAFYGFPVFIIGLILLIWAFFAREGVGALLIIFFLACYFFLLFIFNVILCWLYNALQHIFGGIEVELEEKN